MNDDAIDLHKGVIAWFARNSVAANLLMMFLIIGGLLTAFTINKQMFPQTETNWIEVSAVYPGAAPPEIEESITIKLEESLRAVQGVERLITRSNRGFASANIEVADDYDVQEVLDEVKSSIDSISTFPDSIERLQVKHVQYRQEVMYLSLYGNLPTAELKKLGNEIQNDIRGLPEVAITEYYSGAQYEIAINVSKDKLREYKLTFPEIADAIRQFSANRSAGEIRAADGIIAVRVEEQAYIGREFENIPLRRLENGAIVYLRDVAHVNDGFEEGVRYSRFDGIPTVTILVGATKGQSITKIADIVHQYVADKQHDLPPGVGFEPWVDMTYYLEGRLDMMIDNMIYGGILVFLLLALFLRLRLAFWVILGLPISFFGALLFMSMSWIDVTINVTSLFGFILVLGIVVDDAIVIGESAHTEITKHGQSVESVIRGAKKVAMPATFGVLTTIAAFIPMLLGSGPGTEIFYSIGVVVVLCLFFSLVESKIILPAHLAHMSPVREDSHSMLSRLQDYIDQKLQYFVGTIYRPLLTRFLDFRYAVMAFFVGLLMISVSLIQSGVVHVVGMPKIPHDFPLIAIEMNNSVNEQSTTDAIVMVEKMIRQVDEQIVREYGQSMIEHIYSDTISRTSAHIRTRLVDPELRPMDSFALADLWRKHMPNIPGLKRLDIEERLFAPGANDGDLSFLLKSSDEHQLNAVAKAVKSALEALNGVYDVNDSRESVIREATFSLKPVAYTLGLTSSDVAAQTNMSLYGLEAQRIVRDKYEIRVMVRYPHQERDTYSAISDILIRTPTGDEVPLVEIANIHLTEGEAQIYREDGQRAVSIWATVNSEEAQAINLANELERTVFVELKKQYPRVSIEAAGQLKEELQGLSEQMRNFILALFVIYALLAIPLRSYTQPLMIMSVIPFGILGALVGHLLLGLDLSRMSMFGIIAATGVVINDSLVMVDFVNRAKAQGEALHAAVIQAGCQRFRAIMLTSITTFAGLIPIITESSLQAKIVIPMAVSLAFGVLFATIVTLLLVPCLYVFLNDAARAGKHLKMFLLPATSST